MPRYLTIPEPIVLLDDNDKPIQALDDKKTQPSQAEMQAGASPIFRDADPETFWSWIRTFALRDKKFNEGFESWEQITRITKACKGAKAGAVVILDESDWKLLVDVIKNPSQPLYRDGFIAMQFMPFIELVVDLKEKKPSKAKRVATQKAANKKAASADQAQN